MSRKFAEAQKRAAAEQVAYTKQCQFWSRSLERNDADMAAVLDLNAEMKTVRNAIQKHSELLLLDLGSGKYRLAPDGRDVLQQVVDDDGGNLKAVSEEDMSLHLQELCVDFLLRRKLRRKLLSRICRRLNRLAVSMDNNGSLDAPPPPKYGDLRLNCEESAIQSFQEIHELQQEALRKIQLSQEEEYLMPVKQEETKKDASEESTEKQDEEPESKKDSSTAEVKEKIDEDVEGAEVKEDSAEAEEPENVQEQPAPPAPLSSQVKTEQEENKEEQQQESGDDNDEADDGPNYEVLKDYKDAYEKTIDADGNVKYTILDQESPNDYTLLSRGGIGATHRSMSAKEKLMEFKRWQTTLLSKIPEQPTYAELGLEDRVFFLEERRARALKKIREEEERVDDDSKAPKKKKCKTDKSGDDDEMQVDDNNDNKSKSSASSSSESQNSSSEDLFAADSDGKESEWDAEQKETAAKDTETADAAAKEKTVVSGNKVEAETTDWVIIDKEEAIEAAEQSASAVMDAQDDGKKNAETEEKDDDDMNISEEEADQKTVEASGKKADADIESGDDMDVSEDEATKNEVKVKDVGCKKGDDGQETGEESEKAEGADSVEEEDGEGAKDDRADKSDDKGNAEEKKEDEPILPKIVRPISLAAVPSFYEQDLRRIKLVHAELMQSSVADYARRRLEESTRDYNYAYQTAIKWTDRFTYVQSQLNSLVHEQRNLQHTMGIAKGDWDQRRRQFEHNKLTKVLPSRNNKAPVGTQTTQDYRARPDRMGICQQVGDCLADVVDAVEDIAKGTIRNEQFSEPLIFPPNAAGNGPSSDEDPVERLKQLEAGKRQELNAISLKIRTAEEDRHRAWKKMLKVKAEHDVPHDYYGPHGLVRRVQLNTSNYMQVPCPQLRRNSAQVVPQMMMHAHAAVASYTPSRRVPSTSGYGMSTSKYSPARIRERIAADGSVAPVSKPKMTKDGLYQRPAGRTRKGMEWDAVKGIWIPVPGK